MFVGSNFKWSLWWHWYQFILILSIPKLYCKCVANNMNFNSIQHLPHGCRHLVNKLLGSKVFLVPKNESALAGTNRLVKGRSRKPGSIPERYSIKLASIWHQLCGLQPVMDSCFTLNVFRQLAILTFKRHVRSFSCYDLLFCRETLVSLSSNLNYCRSMHDEPFIQSLCKPLPSTGWAAP